MFRFVFFLLLFSVLIDANAESLSGDSVIAPADTFTVCLDVKYPASPDSVQLKSVPVSFKSKKIIAAVLAFPLPFGILGLHRIFLGTKPYIPFAYIGTIGGCFGVLPFIDFITILSSNEAKLKPYENNPRVFMWSH